MESCGICLEEYEDGDELIEFECKHSLHKSCSEGMLSNKCPFCRSPITFPEDIAGKIEKSIFLDKVNSIIQETDESRKYRRKTKFTMSTNAQLSALTEYFITTGLPLSYFPEEIEISFCCEYNSDIYDTYMFIALLNYLVSEIEKDVEDEDGTPSIFELMDQSILSPFFSDNVLYSSNSVKIVFKFLDEL